MCFHRLLPVVLAISYAAIAGQLAKGQRLTSFEITDNFGKQRIVHSPVFNGFTKDFYDALKLELSPDVDLRIPWGLINEAVAEKGRHAVTLRDGSRYVGTLSNGMKVADRPSTSAEWEEYRLSEAKRLRVVNDGAAATNTGNSRNRREIMTVRLDFMTPPFSIARFRGFHGKTGQAEFHVDPERPDQFTITFDKIKDTEYGETFQADIGGERVDGELSSFEKFVLSKAEGNDEWQVTLRAAGQKQLTGKFLPGNDADRSSLSSWSMKFETTNGCTLVVTKPSCTITITTKHGDARREPNASIVCGSRVVAVHDGARFMLGTKIIARLPKGTEIEVSEVRGDWIGGYGRVDGTRVSGWVKRDQVRAQ